MKVWVIAAVELRDRQRFISKPLLCGGHDVVILKTKPFWSFMFNLLRFLLAGRPEIIIFMGTGIKELLVYHIVTFWRVPCMVRLGGDRLRDLDSVRASQWDKGHYASWLKYTLNKLISQLFLKKIGVAIVVNKALELRVSKQLREKQRIFVVPQFCDGPSETKSYNIDSPAELLTVTNFRFSEKAEGVIWLIDQLCAFVQKNKIHIRLKVAGAGLHLADVEKHLSSLQNVKFLSVELLGFVENLDAYYQRANILLYRSFHDATPNVIIESKRFGLPLLVNDCEEFRTIVDHGVSALIYRDSVEFLKSLKDLLDKQFLRENLGQGALLEHEEKFSLKAIQSKLENVLQETINSVEM